MFGHKITALVPMKKISERVPNKNIRMFADKPLFYYVLNSLQSVKYIEKIVINTDSSQIMEMASSFSKVIFHKRPASICGGHVPMNSIIDYDVAHAAGEFFLQTHSTNPMLSSATITQAIEKFFEILPQNDSLFSVNMIRQRLYSKNLIPINHNPKILQNTQDLEPIFEENSCMYLFSRTSFIKNGKNRIGCKPYAFVMSQVESCDIDTEDDFQLAEKIFLTQKEKV